MACSVREVALFRHAAARKAEETLVHLRMHYTWGSPSCPCCCGHCRVEHKRVSAPTKQRAQQLVLCSFHYFGLYAHRINKSASVTLPSAVSEPRGPLRRVNTPETRHRACGLSALLAESAPVNSQESGARWRGTLLEALRGGGSRARARPHRAGAHAPGAAAHIYLTLPGQ